MDADTQIVAGLISQFGNMQRAALLAEYGVAVLDAEQAEEHRQRLLETCRKTFSRPLQLTQATESPPPEQ